MHQIQVVLARSETFLFLRTHCKVFRLEADKRAFRLLFTLLFTRFVVLIEQCTFFFVFFFLIALLETLIDLRRIKVDVLWIKQTFIIWQILLLLLLFLIVVLFNVYIRQLYKQFFFVLDLRLGIIVVYSRLYHNGFVIYLYLFVDLGLFSFL